MNCLSDFWDWLRGKRRICLSITVGPFTEQTQPVPSILARCRHWGGAFKHQGDEFVADIVLPDSQQFPITVKGAKDKKNNPTPLPPGSVVYLTDNPALLSVTPSADGMSCVVAAAGPLGECNVTVKLVGADGSTVAAKTIDVLINAGAATTLDIDVGTPVEQP